MKIHEWYNDELPLSYLWPHVYERLFEIRNILETNFRDVCDLEFTIQKGHLYILGTRIAKRTSKANLRFALQFFNEGKINLSEAVSRVRPDDVEAFLTPNIVNLDELVFVGTAMPASPGIATGRIVFSREKVENISYPGDALIFVRPEVNHEDIHAISSANGVLTTRGGLTSHAAVICRGIGKPCVVGFTDINIISMSRATFLGRNKLCREGDWITINGYTGEVYFGKANIRESEWERSPELRVLAEMIEHVVISGDFDILSVGSIWRIRDFFAHRLPLRRIKSNKISTHHRTYTSFVQPSLKKIEDANRLFTITSPEEREDCSQILLGFSEALSRLLASNLGLGNHHKYFRPLWDPKTTIVHYSEVIRTQLIGFEYFDINRYVIHLPDISDIIFLMKVALYHEEEQWFLDVTNPNGESLVVNSDIVLGYKLYINGASVQHKDLPVLYNILRRREYYWQWYVYNKTSHDELVQFLREGIYLSLPKSRLTMYCEELGLIFNGELTKVGLSMIGKADKERNYDFFSTGR